MDNRSHLSAVGLTPRLLSRVEAAEYVGLSPNAFDQYVAKEVPPLSLGRRNLWDIKALDAWIDRRAGVTQAVTSDGWDDYVGKT